MKEIFRFSRSERIASLIILVLTLAVLLGLAYVRHLRPLPAKQVRVLDSLITVALPAGEISSAGEEKPEREAGSPVTAGKKKLAPPPVRDPNTMTRREWEELGLPPRVIRTLLNYRSKGGVFRKKEDVKKIYGMSDSLYGRIAPFLAVEEEMRQKEVPPAGEKAPTSSPALYRLEINSADSAAFDSLPGIPPFLARRIVRYRKLLGGFVRKEQLLEVYGLDSTTYAKIKERITTDTVRVRKINVNTCDETTLSRHPYLSQKDAGAVIFYRDHFGRITDLQVLSEQHVLPEKTFLRIRPYLQTDPEK